jgi:hypothetical protein
MIMKTKQAVLSMLRITPNALDWLVKEHEFPVGAMKAM